MCNAGFVDDNVVGCRKMNVVNPTTLSETRSALTTPIFASPSTANEFPIVAVIVGGAVSGSLLIGGVVALIGICYRRKQRFASKGKPRTNNNSSPYNRFNCWQFTVVKK